MNFGFPEDLRRAADARLDAQCPPCRTAEQRQHTAKEQLSYYEEWRSHTEMSPLELDREIPELCELDRLRLWYLLYAASGRFANPTPSFRCFLYDEALELCRGGKVDQVYGMVQLHIGRWSRIISANLSLRKVLRPDEYLNYDDVQGLFLLRTFLDDYREQKPALETLWSCVDPGIAETGKWKIWDDTPALREYVRQCSKLKTYRERCGGPGGVIGWLTILRSHYWLFGAHGVLFALLLVLTQHNWAVGPPSGRLIIVLIGIGSILATVPRLTARYWTGTPPGTTTSSVGSARPDRVRGPALPKVPQSPGGVRRRVFWGVVLSLKILWSVAIFNGLRNPTTALLESQWLFPGGQYLLVLVLWSPFILFFFLDTFAIFFLAEAVMGYVLGKTAGVAWFRAWNRLPRSVLAVVAKAFLYKTRNLSDSTSSPDATLWDSAWNAVIHHLYEADLLRSSEKKRYQKCEERQPELSCAPRNEEARNRLLFFLGSFAMDLPEAPDWEQLPSRTILIPVHEEAVIYSFQELNGKAKSCVTPLHYLIEKYPDEWDNFVARLKEDPERSSPVLIDTLERRQLVGHGPAYVIGDAYLERQICLWGSFRFQTLARTLRGAHYHRYALELFARNCFPGESEEQIGKRVDEKLQILVQHDFVVNDEAPPPSSRGNGLASLWAEFPHFEVACVEREADGSSWSHALYRSGEERLRYALPLATVDGNHRQKPERQNLALQFARGEIIQTMDMNQDDYFEEALKMPCCLAEFERDPTLVLVGFPERIITERHSAIAACAAFADRVFCTLVQRVLHWLGVRMHYGHPDLWKACWATTRGGISKPSYVNEDIFAAYDVLLQGGSIGFVEYLQAGKAREAGISSTAKQYRKFGLGAGEQAISRYVYWLNNSSTFSLTQRLSHFYGSLGVFLAFSVVKWAAFVYLVVIIVIGVSGFVSIGLADQMTIESELFLGLLGVFFAQSLLAAGISQSLLEDGVWRMIRCRLPLAPGLITFFQFQILNFAVGFSDALHDRRSGIEPTGRGMMLEHEPVAQVCRQFRGSHLHWTSLLLAILIAGVSAGQGLPLLWSAPVIVAALSGLLVPFLGNPMATPWRVPTGEWWKHLRLDLGCPVWEAASLEDEEDETAKSRKLTNRQDGAHWWLALREAWEEPPADGICLLLWLAAAVALTIWGWHGAVGWFWAYVTSTAISVLIALQVAWWVLHFSVGRSASIPIFPWIGPLFQMPGRALAGLSLVFAAALVILSIFVVSGLALVLQVFHGVWVSVWGRSRHRGARSGQ